MNSFSNLQEETKNKNEKFHDFVNKLEIGEDGTIFGPYDKYTDKAYRKGHFGLSILLTYAFDLAKKENNITEENFIQISYNQFYNYVENARKILTNMNYIEGDRLFPNKFELTVYENPKNYSVVELDTLIPMTEEQLQRSYIVKNIHVNDQGFFTQQPLDTYKKTNENLTPREKEAFYGMDAKKSLGIIPKNKIKTKH